MRGTCTIESLEQRALLAAAVGDIAGRMLAADLDGDGTDELVVVNGDVIEAWTISNGVRDSVTTVYTQIDGERLVGAGDFDGDGSDDLLIRRPFNDDWGNFYEAHLRVLSAKDGQSYALTPQMDPYKLAGTADVDADGRDEILIGGTAWKASRPSVACSLGALSNDPLQRHTGDMDGDGDEDLIFINSATGDVGFWRISMRSEGGTQVPFASEYVYLGASDPDNWQLLGFSSTAGAGQLLWLHDPSGTIGAWTSAQGVTSYHTVGQLETGWRPVTVAELNGDSDDDLLVQNATTGALIWWAMSNGVAGSATQLFAGPTDQYNIAPDLVITAVRYAAGTYQYGEDVSISVDVLNQGGSGHAGGGWPSPLPPGYLLCYQASVAVSTADGPVAGVTQLWPKYGTIGDGETFSINLQLPFTEALKGPQQLRFRLTALGQETYTNNTFVAPRDLFGSARPVSYPGDFDGDGDSDVLVDNSAQQRWEVWVVSDSTRSEVRNIDVVPGSHPPRVGDFDGDGTDDILVQNDDGTYETWMMQNGQIRQKNALGPGAFLRGVGDIDGNGTDDLVWSVGQGWTGAWIMLDGRAARWQMIGQARYKDWALLDLADMDNDGDDDFLWSSDKTRTLESWDFGLWLMDSGAPRWVYLGKSDGGEFVGFDTRNGGRFIASGDFDGNGAADLLLAGIDGNGVECRRIWMTAPNLGHFVKVTGVGQRSQIGIGDVNGDGKDDVIYRGVAFIMDGPDPVSVIYPWP